MNQQANVYLKQTDGYLIGIDLGGTNIKAALLDLQGSIITKNEIATGAEDGPAGVIQRIIQLATGFLEQVPSKGEVLGVGIGVPGVIGYQNGTVIFAPNIHWRDVPLKQLLKEKINLPIFLDNDANAAALGEKWCGAAKGSKNAVVITIGTGIGSGVILNGQIFRGSGGSAGEIGHTVIMENGPLCNCGKRGCLETLTAAPAIVRMAREVVAKGQSPAMNQLHQIEAKDVFQVAEQGDAGALEVVKQAAKYLGMGIANVVNLLNPELVVLGGGVARAGEILFAPIRSRIGECALEGPASLVRIVGARLGNDAGSIGAGAIVLEERGII